MGQQSGIFLVDKPKGLSTNQLIQRIKHRLGIEKVGHAGTLDPLAEGLVIVLVNQATKLSPIFLNEEKGYTATVELFTSTTTADREGEVLKKEEPFLILDSDLRDLVLKFNNYHYEQQTPLFSAVKVKGQKLYQYARKNEAVSPPKRNVIIKKFEIDYYDANQHTLKIQTIVSKGTYIRTLAEDIAHHLKTIGHLQQLTRTQSGNFTIAQAKNWETVNWNDLINLYDTLLTAKYPIVLFEGSLRDVSEGKKISLPPNTPPRVFIANAKKEILAYYGLGQDHLYHCLRGGFNNH